MEKALIFLLNSIKNGRVYLLLYFVAAFALTLSVKYFAFLIVDGEFSEELVFMAMSLVWVLIIYDKNFTKIENDLVKYASSKKWVFNTFMLFRMRFTFALMLANVIAFSILGLGLISYFILLSIFIVDLNYRLMRETFRNVRKSHTILKMIYFDKKMIVYFLLFVAEFLFVKYSTDYIAANNAKTGVVFLLVVLIGLTFLNYFLSYKEYKILPQRIGFDTLR